jgi:hypothetical protein
VGGNIVSPCLQKDLESELDGAAVLEEAHGLVEVDVVARGEDDRGLWVVAGTLERLVPPLLDSILLRVVQNFELCRRHAATLRLGERVTRLFVQFDGLDATFSGGFANP